jgi:hypothetical protein
MRGIHFFEPRRSTTMAAFAAQSKSVAAARQGASLQLAAPSVRPAASRLHTCFASASLRTACLGQSVAASRSRWALARLGLAPGPAIGP